jgi:hypothetical protein
MCYFNQKLRKLLYKFMLILSQTNYDLMKAATTTITILQNFDYKEIFKLFQCRLKNCKEMQINRKFDKNN